jgi:hypothetical protein
VQREERAAVRTRSPRRADAPTEAGQPDTAVSAPRASDFSNGFLVAEVLSRYYPSEVALHSFDPAATNVARKRDAWELILKLTRVRARLRAFCAPTSVAWHALSHRVHLLRRSPSQKLGFVLSRAEAEAVIACEPDAAPTLVARLFDFLTPVARGVPGLYSLRCVLESRALTGG